MSPSKVVAVFGCVLIVASSAPAATGATAKPDLVVTNIVAGTDRVVQGETLSVTETTKNKGRRSAVRSRTGFFLSENAQRDKSDVALTAKRRVPSLKPYASSTGSIEVTVPSRTDPGVYRVLACADIAKAVVEVKESNNCRATATTIDVAAAPSYALIDQDLAAGRISQDQAVLYKVYVDFDDARLPERYIGDDTQIEEGIGLREANELWPSLSPVVQETLKPFFVLPFYERSWLWYRDTGTPWPSLTEREARRTSAAEQATGATVPAERFCKADLSAVDGTFWSGWDSVATTNGKFRVWWEAEKYPDDEFLAQAWANELDGKIWRKLTDLLGRESLGDSGNTMSCRGGDDRRDIVIARGVAHSHAGWYGECTGPSPGYIVMRRDARFGHLIHEVMHTFQFAFEWRNCDDPRWIWESTANWAEDFVEERDQAEQASGGSFLADPGTPLDHYEYLDLHAYGAYLWWFYLSRKEDGRFNDSNVVKRVFENAKTMDSLEAVDAAIAGSGRFLTQWKRFALYNLNLGPELDHYKEWDEFPFRAHADPDEFVFFLDTPTKTYPLDGSVEHLSASYATFDFPTDSNVKFIRFQNTFGNAGDHATVWLVKTLANGTQTFEDVTVRDEVTLCRSNADENVEHLAIVLANGSMTKDISDSTTKVELGKECEFAGHGNLSFTWVERDVLSDESSAANHTRRIDTSLAIAVAGSRLPFGTVLLEDDGSSYETLWTYNGNGSSTDDYGISCTWTATGSGGGQGGIEATATLPQNAPEQLNLVFDSGSYEYTIDGSRSCSNGYTDPIGSSGDGMVSFASYMDGDVYIPDECQTYPEASPYLEFKLAEGSVDTYEFSCSHTWSPSSYDFRTIDVTVEGTVTVTN